MMKELQFTPIVNGVMITPEYLKQMELAERNARAMEYINRKAEERRIRRWQISEAICQWATIVVMVVLTGLMFWR